MNIGNRSQDAGEGLAVAIVGMAFRFPGDLADEDSLWDALTQKRDLISQVPGDRWATDELQHAKRSEPGKSIIFSAGVLSKIDEFDAGFFGISAREASVLDPQQRLLLELAWEAIENAGIPASSLAGSDCSVYVGISSFDNALRGVDDLSAMTSHSMTGNALSIAANRLSYVFDLRGPSLAVDTACSSSLVALHHACNSLRHGDASMALVGGVNLLLHPQPFVGFTKASMLSADGRCKAFDEAGNGYVRSEGGAVLLLKPLEAAIADGDDICAVILSTGVNSDGGQKTGLTIPSVQGQAQLMREVLARSGVCAEDVDFIEAHGTGTAVGDPIEAAAIGMVYGSQRSAPLPISSIKANLGHLEPASGMAGLVKAILALKKRELPPSLHLEVPNPHIDLDKLNLQLVKDRMLFAKGEDKSLIAGVNSFGFGGTNAHVLLKGGEAISTDAANVTQRDLPPLCLSARSDAALRELAGLYANLLSKVSEGEYYDIAYSSVFHRDCLEKRLVTRPDSIREATEGLRHYSETGEQSVVILEDKLPQNSGIAFIYSGNGAQWLGMGRKLLVESSRFAIVISELDQLMYSRVGFSLLTELTANDADSRLDDTTVAQPLLFAIQVAVTRLMGEQGIAPVAVAGHSVGEVAAAWAAGALSLDQAIEVIAVRSQAQGVTRGIGRMAVVALSVEAIQEILLDLGPNHGIEIAGINSPGNVTLSGELEQLMSLKELLRAKSIVFKLLDLDYAFHSRFMDTIRESLEKSLAGLTPSACGEVTFVSTVTGGVIAGEELTADYWWRNVREPVRFVDAIHQIAVKGVRLFVEIGPHAILQRYVAECLAATGIKGRVLPTLRRNEDGEQGIEEAVLRCFCLKSPRSWSHFFPHAGRRVRLPNYPWQRERHWHFGSNEALRSIERRRVHPLLGWRLPQIDAAWENALDPISVPWLADHKVGGAIVYPGAAYVEMALAAAREYYGGDSQELEELDIVSPVVFDGEHARSFRLDLNTRDGSFQIRSRQRLSGDEWSLNASGRLLGAVRGYVSSIQEKLQESSIYIDPVVHYRLANTLGLEYGPLFQGLSYGRLDGSTFEGGVTLPSAADSQQKAWLLHPVVVDVCFQSLLDFFRKEIEDGVGLPLLPVKVGRLRLLGSAPVATFRARILRRSLRSVLAQFELFSADDMKVAVIENCRFRAASLRHGHRHSPPCWQIQAVVRPAVIAASSVCLPPVRQLVQSIREWFVEQEGELKRTAYYNEAQPLLDALVSAFAGEAVKQLLTDKPIEVNAWLDGVNHVSHEHGRMVGWVRDLLVDQACLVRDQESWKLAADDLPPSEEIWRTLLAEYPAAMSELILIGRMGLSLGKLISGQRLASVLTDEIERSPQLETLFDHSLTYRSNRLAIEQVVRKLLDNLPSNRRLRVLEISAGLSEIPRHLANGIDTTLIDYVLAHDDSQICDQLRHEYREDDWVDVADLSGSPLHLEAKSQLPSGYDLVLLRHVLKDSTHTSMLNWAKKRLVSGGLLLVAGRYSDLATDLVWGAERLVGPHYWEVAAVAEGFDDVEICREPAADASAVGPWLLLAKAPNGTHAEVVPEMSRWLLLAADADGEKITSLLREKLMSLGQLAVEFAISNELQSVEMTASILARSVRESEGEIDHVVMVTAERVSDDISLSVEALNLVKALCGLDTTPRLSFVTRGGAPVQGLSDSFKQNPALATLWGIGRVVMNEYPILNCRLIDLVIPSPKGMLGMLDLLAEELLDSDGECEVVLDGDTRRVLRLKQSQLATISERSQNDRRFRLDFLVPGQLRNLLWLDHPARDPGPDEIEVRPLATGLNFRDVMYVMGLLPDEAVENGFAGATLGLEFSGVVTRVGHRVDEFVPGDAVMGFGSSCFSSHVVTRADALALKPEEWSFESAATVPTVFFTVYYALRYLADLQPGERVLIHGAAGGVGIAAVQLARHLGAEVFATAGSEEKREFVTLLGADHVFDSRSLAYADQIMAATNGQGVDVVLNSLAGEAIRRNLRILRPFGRFLELGKRDFFENTPIGIRPFKDNISYFGIDADQLLIARPELAGRLFREVMSLFRSGFLTPLPTRVFPAERIVDAFRYMQQARQIGKVIVSFDSVDIRPQSFLPQQQEFVCVRDAAYLITGGVSGFGLETARWLAESGATQLVLLSRQGEATPGAAEAISSIQALGAQVLVMSCDVTDAESLHRVLAHPGLQPIKGIFHAAMVIDDALIANQNPERMRQVLAPKIQGAWNLHELTRELSLDYFVLYSSVTTYIGNPGQVNYVAANIWLEGLANLRRSLGLPVTCIGWGPIGDAGYLTRNEAVKGSLVNRLGAEPLASSDALRMLGQALLCPQPNLAIADFQISALLRLLPSAQGPRFAELRRHADEATNSADSIEDFNALIAGKSTAEIQVLVTQLVTQEVAQILAISVERVDPVRSLHDLGLDSLMGVELALGLEKRFGMQVPAMLLNEGPTVERITARIVERLSSDDSSSEAGDSDLATSALWLAAQHGEEISRDEVEAAIPDFLMGERA